MINVYYVYIETVITCRQDLHFFKTKLKSCIIKARSHWKECDLGIRYSLSPEIDKNDSIFAIDYKQEEYKWRKHHDVLTNYIA